MNVYIVNSSPFKEFIVPFSKLVFDKSELAPVVKVIGNSSNIAQYPGVRAGWGAVLFLRWEVE